MPAETCAMSHDEFERICWNYYLVLEQDFLNSTRYVYLDTDNFKTFSFDYVTQLFSCCPEFENVLKIASGDDTSANMYPLLRLGFEMFPDLNASVVKIKHAPQITLNPYKFVSDEEPPYLPWWKGYNKVKHNRFENFKNANLGNVINALSALFALDMHYLKKSGQPGSDGKPIRDSPERSSQLFELQNFKFHMVSARNLLYTYD